MDKKFIWGLVIGCSLVMLGFGLGRLPYYQESRNDDVLGKNTENNSVEGSCTTIQDGVLLTSDGNLIGVGFDEWGYNYQGRLFNGTYCDAYRDAAWCQEYKDIELVMKWNDAWMSNKDCDGDGLLDRHFGFDSYVGSGAWETNAMRGEYELDGKTCHWSSFTKIVAVPSEANLVDGYWIGADGKEIGLEIWGQFAIILDIYNDTCQQDGGKWHNIIYHSEGPVGFGLWSK